MIASGRREAQTVSRPPRGNQVDARRSSALSTWRPRFGTGIINTEKKDAVMGTFQDWQTPARPDDERFTTRAPGTSSQNHLSWRVCPGCHELDAVSAHWIGRVFRVGRSLGRYPRVDCLPSITIRPFQSGSLRGHHVQRRQRSHRTMSARAASVTVAALMDAPIPGSVARNDLAATIAINQECSSGPVRERSAAQLADPMMLCS